MDIDKHGKYGCRGYDIGLDARLKFLLSNDE